MQELLSESQCHLVIVLGDAVGVKLLVEEAWLDIGVVLVLVADVLFDLAIDLVVKDLGDGDTGVDFNRLNGKHFQRPESLEAHVAEPRSHVNEQAQTANRRAAFDHGNQIVGFGMLDRSSQIKAIGLQNHARLGDLHSSNPIAFLHVQDDLFVGHDVLVKCKVVTVWVKVFRAERVNLYVVPEVVGDFLSGQNHGRSSDGVGGCDEAKFCVGTVILSTSELIDGLLKCLYC